MRYELFEERTFRFTWFAVHPLTAATWAAEAALLVLGRSLFGEYFRPVRQRKITQIFSWTVFLFLFLILVLTNSRGPLLAFLAAAGLMVWKFLRAGMARGLVAVTTVLLLSIGLLGASVSDDSSGLSDSVERAQGQPGQQGLIAERIFRGGNMDTLRGLNGRVEVWEGAMSLIADKPLLGYGYHGSRSFMFEKFPWASYAHSAYVQSLLDFGIVGAVLVWGALALTFMRLVLRPFGAVTGVAWCDAAMTGIVAFLAVSSVSSESLIASPGYEALLMFAVAGVVGQYGSPGLRAFERYSTTIGPGLRLAGQGGHRAYRHL
jgi:O-antigen ligase